MSFSDSVREEEERLVVGSLRRVVVLDPVAQLAGLYSWSLFTVYS